jgi:hypothetical protein
MADSNTMDFGGLALQVKSLEVGVNSPGSSGTALSSDELASLNGITGSALVQCSEVTFTETSGAGVYTGSVTVPAGAWIIDIIVHGVAVWDNAGAVDMDVGISGAATSYFDITSIKAAGDLVAAESISFSETGSETGTLQATNYARYSASARTIDGIITSASTGGSTGRTRMLVLWAMPNSSTAATKV